MRLPTPLIVLVLVALFGASVFFGYLIGGSFMTPKQSAPTVTAPPSPARSKPSSPPPSPPPSKAEAPQPQATPLQPPAPAPEKPEARLYRVQVGAFLRRENAEAMAERLRRDGYQPYISPTSPYKVQVGAFKDKANAERLAQELQGRGYEVYIAQQ